MFIINQYEMGVYSKGRDDALWHHVGKEYDEDYDYEELLKQIECEEFFRPFSKRLLAYYNDHMDSNFSASEAAKDLVRRAKLKGISFDPRTIKQWFSGQTEPKYGDNDRRRLFAVAFSLELDSEQTERLFHKVYLDRAFNQRNAHELIYFHCIHYKKPFSTAEMLISKLETINLADAPNENTVQTRVIAQMAQQNVDEKDLLNYIVKNQYNFAKNNNAAKKYKKDYLKRLAGESGLAKEEGERRESIGDEYKGRDKTSVDFLLYMIFNKDYANKDKSEIKEINKLFSRKEIHNQFPDKQTLSDVNPSSYVLRKELILLEFYEYWVNDYLAVKSVGSYDSFVEALNGILYECGFSPLYIGNPYDWLFLFCSACVGEEDDIRNPLDVFRDILAHFDEDEDSVVLQ